MCGFHDFISFIIFALLIRWEKRSLDGILDGSGLLRKRENARNKPFLRADIYRHDLRTCCISSLPSLPLLLSLWQVRFLSVMIGHCLFPVGTLAPETNVTLGSTCGGNCPGGCASCPCGTSSNYQSISAWCSKYSWNQANCQCIMQHESNGNANAVNQNGNGGSYDVGLWQINEMNWASCSGGKAPCDGNSNLNCGKLYITDCFYRDILSY